MSEPNRTAELAYELIGAKTAADLLREVWASASPEARQAIADAYLQRAMKEVQTRPMWAVQDKISAALDRYVAEEVAKHSDDIAMEVGHALCNLRQRVESAIGPIVHRIAERAIREALRLVAP